MKNVKYILLLVVGLSGNRVFAGNDIHWSVIDKDVMSADLVAINQHYQRMHIYETVITNASYENYTTSEAHQKSSGYFKREYSQFHSYMLGVHTIQSKTCRLVIDSAKKIMIVADPTNSLDNNFTLSDFEALLKVCTKLQKAKMGNYIYYHMEFQKDYRYTAYDMTLKDSVPEKIVMYYSRKVTKGDKTGQPRMEV
ncbi:MAG TPA: hypothetical protein VN922_06185, partial [Bacteroidia bacterium]|nr:hypothetical protein [Bacteroidia bacterium]